MKRAATACLLLIALAAGTAANAPRSVLPDAAGKAAAAEPDRATVGAPAPAGGAIVVTQSQDQVRGQDIVNARVLNGTGKDAQVIGLVEDLLFDRDGQLVAALVGVGGFLGIGQKTVAVAWTALKRANAPGGPVTFVTHLSRQQLDAAPAFVTAKERKATEQKREVLEKAREQSPVPTPADPKGGD